MMGRKNALKITLVLSILLLNVLPAEAAVQNTQLLIGEKVEQESFEDLAGKAVTIRFNKPTVLMFWASFNTPENLAHSFGLLQKAQAQRGGNADFYTVSINSSPDVADNLKKYGSTVPALWSKNFLRYCSALPGIVVVDQAGVLRFRITGTGSLEELLEDIDQCKEGQRTIALSTADEYISYGLKQENSPAGTERALWAYEQAIALEPNRAEAHKRKAAVLFRIGNTEQALQAMNQALELHPGQKDVLYQRAKALEKLNRIAEANMDYRSILSLSDGESRARLYRALNWEKQGLTQEAIVEYTKLINDKSPELKEAYLHRIDCYVKSGQGVAAEADCSAAIALYPKEDLFYMRQVMLLLQRNEAEKALETLGSAGAANPDGIGYEFRAQMYQDMGQYEPALQDINRIMACNPNHDKVYYLRGNLLGKMQRYQEALQDLREAAKRDSQNWNVLFALAQAQELTGDRVQAQANYALVLEYGPGGGNRKTNKAKARVAGEWDSEPMWVDTMR